jgi:hypothetical protein
MKCEREKLKNNSFEKRDEQLILLPYSMIRDFILFFQMFLGQKSCGDRCLKSTIFSPKLNWEIRNLQVFPKNNCHQNAKKLARKFCPR